MMMTGKRFDRKWLWLNCKVLSWNSPADIEKNHENPNQDSRSPGPRIETGTSRSRPRRSVLLNGMVSLNMQSHIRNKLLWFHWRSSTVLSFRATGPTVTEARTRNGFLGLRCSFRKSLQNNQFQSSYRSSIMHNFQVTLSTL